MIEALADYFGAELDKDEDGKYDIDNYDWTSGCYGGKNSWCDRVWFSLKNVVRALEDLCEEDDWDD